jgi:acetyl-CoA hydrolase
LADIDLRRYLSPGDTVLLGHGAGEPRSLIEALIEQRHDLAPLTLFVGPSFTGLLRPEHADAFRFLGIGGVGRTADLAKAGVLSILPVHFGAVPSLIASDRIAIDAVLVQVSSPDGEGLHSFGLIADYVQAGLARARVAIAEVNPSVPFTFGETLVPASSFAASVVDERRPVTVEQRAPLAEDEVIGRLVATIIPDGATIQFGVGGTPDAVLGALREKNDLGVHSGLISDALVDLVDAGVVTNRYKEIDPGVTVTGSLWGSERMQRWAHRNRTLSMRSAAYTHDAVVLSAFQSFYAINSAIEVDLTGQVNGESAAGQYVGLVGGQGAFARAAMTSRSGRSVVALPSTARGGTVSRIVTRLDGGIASAPRADSDLVVTEHGIADLRGATLEERAERMLAIADPRHRDELRALARAST